MYARLDVLRAVGPGYAHAARNRHFRRSRQEGRLADTGLVGQQLRRSADEGYVEKGLESLQLVSAADEPVGARVDGSHGRSPAAPKHEGRAQTRRRS